MKYIKQFSIILTISFLGELLKSLLPLPIPASIYGLLLMLAALSLHVLPVSSVRDTAKFLIEIMPLMFIPAAVGLTESWDKISPILPELVIMTAVSTVLVMAVSGRVTQAVIRRGKNGGGEVPLDAEKELKSDVLSAESGDCAHEAAKTGRKQVAEE